MDAVRGHGLALTMWYVWCGEWGVVCKGLLSFIMWWLGIGSHLSILMLTV